MILAFTYLIKFYLTEDIPIRDNEDVKIFFKNLKKDSSAPEQIRKVLGHQVFWKTDLNDIHELPELMTTQLQLLNNGAGIEDFLSLEA